MTAVQGAGGKRVVRTEADLRAHFGEVDALARNKVIHRLDGFCRDFIALSPFLVIASSDGAGNVDATPRGDAPGFVAVADDVTLVIPDRRGNNRVDTLSNVLASPGVGLIFFVPGINETLRVNGNAAITQDAALLTPLAAHGVTPTIGITVHVREAYFHCGKALIRSGLWAPQSHVARERFPSLGRVLAGQTAAVAVEAAEQAVEAGYRTRLY